MRSVSLDPNQRTAASLAPAIAEVFDELRESGRAIDFVSVADGPGSFTGLRVGVTTAKTLCYALALPLVAVDSLAAIAASGFHEDSSTDALLVAIDAYRGQIFRGQFSRSGLLPPVDRIPEDWTAHPACVEVQEAMAFQRQLASAPKTLSAAGDSKPFGSHTLRRIETKCDAIGVGLIAVRAANRGLFVDPIRLVPRYLKVSAAEENASRASI